MLNAQLPWYIAGPALGLCVVVVRALLNQRIGVTGSLTEVIEKVGRRSLSFGWRGCFYVGLIAGGALFALLAGGPDFHGYGWLTQTFTGSWRWVVAPILVVSGVLIGWGSKLAGGCTSGNGLSGVSLASVASMVATAIFFATAIVVSFVIQALT
jgi:uncharacterized protein